MTDSDSDSGVDERALVAEPCRFSSLVLVLVLALAQSSQAGAGC